MYSVRQILRENWKKYLKTHNPAGHQRDEIQKILNCSKNSCNSRMCSSCGKRYADDWSKNLNFNPKRHTVLTVPSFLRENLRDWNNLSTLIRSSRDFC